MEFKACYYKCNIYCNKYSQLKYSSYVIDHFIYADTLVGIKKLIKHYKGIK